MMREAQRSGYWGSLVSSADSVTFIVVPACSALFAWDIASLKRAQILAYPAVRPWSQILASRALPSLMLGWLTLILCWLVLLPRAASTPGLGDMLDMVAAMLRVPAGLSLGLMAGLSLPFWLAPALTLIIEYVWTVYPQAFPTFWIRHLTGWHPGALVASTQLAPRAVAAGIAFSLAWIVCGLIILIGYRADGSLGARVLIMGMPCVAVLVAGTLFAVWLASPYGPDPVETRIDSLVCTTASVNARSDRIRVCVWPEHAKHLAAATQQAVSLVESLDVVGFPTSSTITESTGETDTWIRANMINGLQREIGVQEYDDQCSRPESLYSQMDIARIWLAQTTKTQAILDNYEIPDDQEHRQIADSLSSLSVQEQAQWVHDAITQHSHFCRSEPGGVR